MKYVATKQHNTKGLPNCTIDMYGYKFQDGGDTFWSMKFYEETWHVPMNPNLIHPKSLEFYKKV